jgi:CBS domain-containing protein
MCEPPVLLRANMDVASALARLDGQSLDAWPVMDERGLCGMIRRSDRARAASDGQAHQSLAQIIHAEMRGDEEGVPHLHPDHTLSIALERMGRERLNVLPVVSRANIRNLLGIVVLEDVLEGYGVSRASSAQAYRE